MTASLTDDWTRQDARPYFLWDETTTVREFRARLAVASPEEKSRLLGKLLREARDTDVWFFTTVKDVRAHWPTIERHLGRRREFWGFVLQGWARLGLA
jgi:hypothetical protein